MPHGVGHHHHVHHHHHNGGGLRVHHHHRHPYFYGGYYGYGYRRRPITWVIFSCAITVIIILSTTLTVRYTASSDSDDSDITYGPTDTRLISVNRVFCGSVIIKTDLPTSDGYTVNLYSLGSPPQLAGSETFNEHPTINDYTTYISFMPKGSSFNMSACLLSTDVLSFTFYLVRGSDNYGIWQDNRWEDDVSSVEKMITVSTSCETGNDSLAYSVTEGDFLYLIFETYDGLYSSEDINVTISYNQKRYVLDNDTILDSCSLQSDDYFSACSVGYPLTGSSTTLLQVVPNNEDEMGLSDSIAVDAYCGARVWMYVLLSLIILVTLVVCFVVLTICLYCFCIKKKKRVTAAAAVTTTADRNITTAQSVNTPLLQDTATAPPPPFTDPIYPQSTASTSYGSNYDAPPTYKE